MKKLRLLRGRASKGLKHLAHALKDQGVDVLRSKLHGSTYKGHRDHVIVNWGSVTRNNIRASYRIINDPSAVVNSASKVKTFECLDGSGMANNRPSWTTSIDVASEWLESGQADKVYCRTLTHGSQGRGIVIANSVDELVDAGLYTIGLDVNREVRVHVFNNEVIDYAQKRRMNSNRREDEGITLNEEVRSHKNGWIFAREGVGISEETKEVAIKAVESVGLDFGAVDIILDYHDIPKVLEVNSSPGLEGTTLSKYTEAILGLCQSTMTESS